MAVRTPGLQQRSQYHRNWGNYTDGGQTTPANGDLPNQPSNALANPEFSKLEAGDLAYVTTTDPGVYYCVSPGTVGGGDATWTLLAAGGAVVQTIRDAHQIVVGQSSAPYSNVLNQDADVLDPGDGTGIETALANASALIAGGYAGVDVRVRPCAITLNPANLAAVPLSVDTNVRLIGAGHGISLITGGDGTGATSQDLFQLNAFSRLEDFTLTSPAPAAAPGVGNGMIDCLSSGAKVSKCRFLMQRSITVPRNGTTRCVYTVAPDEFEVDDCFFDVDDLIPDAQVGTGVEIEAASDRIDYDPVIKNCKMRDGNRFVYFRDHEGGVVQNCQHDGAIDPNGSIRWDFVSAPTGATPLRGPRISGFRLDVADSDQNPHVGIQIFTSQADAEVNGIEISDCKLLWNGVAQPGNSRTGIFIATSGPGGAATAEIAEAGIANVNIGGPTAIAPSNAVILAAQGEDDVIQSVSITNLQTTNNSERGVYMNPSGANASVEFCSVANSKIRNAGTAAVELVAGCLDCIILGNNFNNSFAGIVDAGTGTEAAHNI